MKRTSISLFGLLAAASLSVSTAHAQYYLRGTFNNWDTSAPLTDNGNGTFSATVSGTPGASLGYKIANADWSSAFAGSDVGSVFNSSGSFTANFIPSPAADGWGPTANRVGYNDPQQFGWEIMGSFNAWSAPVVSLTSMGAGLYAGDYVIASPGSYTFKFREAGSWAVSIGSDFGNSATDIGVTALTAGDFLHFQLDLPNGRFQVSEVPEPGLLSLLGVGFGLLFLRRNRRPA